jgi:hypothetical protein
VLRPIKGALAFSAALQFILAMGVTILEQNCFYSTVLPVIEGKETFAKQPAHLD